MKILVVIDMQNDFLTGELGNEMCKKAIEPVCKLIIDNKWDCKVFTKDTHFENYPDTLEGKKLPVRHCISGTWGWALCSSVAKCIAGAYVIVNKPTFGSFGLLDSIEEFRVNMCGGDRNLAARNGECGQNLEIHVCGVCTSICVLANVVLIRAKYPDAKIVVHADACGDVTPEMHKAAIVCFKSQQCEVVGE